MKKAEGFAVAALVSCAVFMTAYWALAGSPYAIGIDGYYYAAQIRSYLEKGRFFASDSSWVLYAMASFSRLGPDIVVMNKIFVAAFSVAFFWSAHAVLQLFTGRLVSIFLAAALLASSYLQFGRSNFIKNFVGLVFFTIFLRQILLRLKTGAPVGRQAQLLTIATFFACLVSHTQTAFLAALTVIAYLALVICRQTATDMRLRRRWLWISIAGGTVLVFLFYINRARFSGFTLSDFINFRGLFPLQLADLNPGNKRLAVEAFVLMAINVAFLVRYAWRLVRERSASPAETMIAVLLIVTANPFYTAAEAQWGFRLHLVSILPTAIAFTMVLPANLRLQSGLSWRVAINAATLVLIALSGVQLQHSLRIGQIDYAEIQAAVAKLALPDRHLLIAHQGFDYFYCYSRKGDAFHFLAEDKHRGRAVFRILHGFPADTLKDVQFTMPPQRLTRNYTLISEADFPKITAKLSPLEKQLLLTYRNPTAQRDLFLRDRDRSKSDQLQQLR